MRLLALIPSAAVAIALSMSATANAQPTAPYHDLSATNEPPTGVAPSEGSHVVPTVTSADLSAEDPAVAPAPVRDLRPQHRMAPRDARPTGGPADADRTSNATAASQHGSSEGDAVHDGHDGHGAPGKINWYLGLLGKDADLDTDAGKEESLLWRRSSTPPPFLANLINFAVFGAVVYYFGRRPLQNALKERRQTIMKEIDAATKMREEAADRLAEYEDRLQHLDDEIDRIREDFRAQGQREKERILADARERKARMLKDAQFMIDQEVRQMRITLMQDAVELAVDAAERLLRAKTTGADHDRIAEDYVKRLASSNLTLTRGGSA